MDIVSNVFMDLGFNINNGEVLEIIKEERERCQIRLNEMKKEKSLDYSWLQKQVRLKLSYDIVIQCFERMLGHDN